MGFFFIHNRPTLIYTFNTHTQTHRSQALHSVGILHRTRTYSFMALSDSLESCNSRMIDLPGVVQEFYYCTHNKQCCCNHFPKRIFPHCDSIFFIFFVFHFPRDIKIWKKEKHLEFSSDVRVYTRQ